MALWEKALVKLDDLAERKELVFDVYVHAMA